MLRETAALALVLGCIAHDAAEAKGFAGTVAAYVDIVSLYRAGRTAEAISALSRWRLDEIEDAANTYRSRRSFAPGSQGADRRAGEAAVLLHEDTALVSWLSDAPAEHDLHLRLALQLILELEGGADASQYPSSAPITPRELYVALAAAELSVLCPRGATSVAEQGLKSCVGDSQLLLIAGVAQETQALTFAHAGREHAEAAALRSAQARLAAAHRAAPSFETRLRLGRVEAQRGRTAEARQLLEEALGTARDSRQRYLAGLCLGRVYERSGRLRRAEQTFRAALEQVPNGQAARIALAHVVETAAGPNEARPIVLESLAASPRQDRRADPWWSYYSGPPELARGPLTRLRQRVSQP